MFPGLPGWLNSLRDLHMPRQLEDLEATALAAEARVARFEDGGRMDVHRRAARTAARTSRGGDWTL
eukprot:3570558-Pyramimonas_sp.AAC.1